MSEAPRESHHKGLPAGSPVSSNAGRSVYRTDLNPECHWVVHLVLPIEVIDVSLELCLFLRREGVHRCVDQSTFNSTRAPKSVESMASITGPKKKRKGGRAAGGQKERTKEGKGVKNQVEDVLCPPSAFI